MIKRNLKETSKDKVDAQSLVDNLNISSQENNKIEKNINDTETIDDSSIKDAAIINVLKNLTNTNSTDAQSRSNNETLINKDDIDKPEADVINANLTNYDFEELNKTIKENIKQHNGNELDITIYEKPDSNATSQDENITIDADSEPVIDNKVLPLTSKDFTSSDVSDILKDNKNITKSIDQSQPEPQTQPKLNLTKGELIGGIGKGECINHIDLIFRNTYRGESRKQ